MLNLDVLKEHGKRDKIGNPVSLEQEMAARGPATSTTAQPQQATATSFYGNKPAAAAAAPARDTAQRPNKYVISILGVNQWFLTVN